MADKKKYDVDALDVDGLLKLMDVGADPTDKAEFDPEQISGHVDAPNVDRPNSSIVSDREVLAGVKDANADRRPEADNELNYSPDTSFKFQSDMPKSDPAVIEKIRLQYDPEYAYGKKVEAIKGKRVDDQKEIEKLLSGLDEKQGEQKRRQGHARAQAFALRAGDVMRSGMAGLPSENIPIPDKYDVAHGEAEKIGMRNKLQDSSNKWQDQDLDRATQEKLFQQRVDAEVAKQLRDQGFKVKDREDKQEHDTEEKKKASDVKQSEGDKNRKAGIVRPIVAATVTNSSQGARADAEFANRQAERQIGGGWESTGPHSQTDETRAAHLAGSEASVQKIGRETVAAMRKHGRNLPQSTEWLKLESSMSVLHEDLNKLHEEGVMNFGDKGNRIVESGDPQSFKQWILDQGPDVLEHALDNIAKTTDARMGPLKYRRNPNAKMKLPSEYMNQSSGGGSQSSPLQDPNVVPGLVDFINNGGPMPQLRSPPGGHGKVVEEFGGIRKYDDGFFERVQ